MSRDVVCARRLTLFDVASAKHFASHDHKIWRAWFYDFYEYEAPGAGVPPAKARFWEDKVGIIANEIFLSEITNFNKKTKSTGPEINADEKVITYDNVISAVGYEGLSVTSVKLSGPILSHSVNAFLTIVRCCVEFRPPLDA